MGNSAHDIVKLCLTCIHLPVQNLPLFISFTVPSPPGSIEVTDVTNSSLQFRWDRPENMDIGEYIFIVSYQTAQAPNSKHFAQEANNSTISNLTSGTQYTITVLTTIPQNLNSTIMRKSIYTSKCWHYSHARLELFVLSVYIKENFSN